MNNFLIRSVSFRAAQGLNERDLAHSPAEERIAPRSPRNAILRPCDN